MLPALLTAEGEVLLLPGTWKVMKKACSSPTLSWANPGVAHTTGQTMQTMASKQFQIFEEDILFPPGLTYVISTASRINIAVQSQQKQDALACGQHKSRVTDVDSDQRFWGETIDGL